MPYQSIQNQTINLLYIQQIKNWCVELQFCLCTHQFLSLMKFSIVSVLAILVTTAPTGAQCNALCAGESVTITEFNAREVAINCFGSKNFHDVKSVSHALYYFRFWRRLHWLNLRHNSNCYWFNGNQKRIRILLSPIFLKRSRSYQRGCWHPLFILKPSKSTITISLESLMLSK